MSDQLKPCPFCGGKAELWRAHAERTAWIACMSKCSVLVSKEYKTDAEAIAAWNRREIPAAQPSPDVAALVDAVIMLNAACDAMWNDHERLEKNPDSFGQKYRLKETHLRAISEAQQNLPLVLARVKGGE